jgi:hypothetical protein
LDTPFVRASRRCSLPYLILDVEGRSPSSQSEVTKVENVTLGPDYAQKLSSLAERAHVQEGTLARSLLSSALDEANPDASRITEILDGIPGAWERAQESIEQARRGETVPLSEL